MTAGLLLMKSALTPQCFVTIWIIGSNVSNKCSYSKKKKKKNGSGTTELIISNEEMEDIMKIYKSHEESGLLIQGIRETIKN